MDPGTWWAIVHGVAESDVTEVTWHNTQNPSETEPGLVPGSLGSWLKVMVGRPVVPISVV